MPAGPRLLLLGAWPSATGLVVLRTEPVVSALRATIPCAYRARRKSHKARCPWGGGEQNQHVQPVGSWRWWAFGQRQNSPRPQLGQWPHGTPSASSGGEESEMRPVPLLPKLTQLGFGGFVSSSPMPFSARASLRRSRYLPIQRALGLIRYRVVGRPPSGIFPLSPAAIQSRSLSRLRPATT